MIYVIKENGYGYKERIVCAVSDEKTAKRYCRDMRTGRELFYEAVDLDAVTMDEISAEKIYVVERRVPWKANKDVPEIPPSSRDEGLRLLHGLATNLATSLQTPQEA